MNLNERAARLCARLDGESASLRIHSVRLDCGAVVWDFGIKAEGGLSAGLWLARACMADLAEVQCIPDHAGLGPAICVRTDHPVSACMASQYAGWQINPPGFFAMGSGPMRAAASVEPLFGQIGHQEKAEVAVGVVETSQMPTSDVAVWIAERCGVPADRLRLLAARTASAAGNVQVVSRCVETAMHKMHDLGFDLRQVCSGFGFAPLPPVASDDLVGIGRTNDAILYGGQVTLWVRAEDETLAGIVGEVPSCASRDFGQPFGSIFARYDRDFYKIDPHLFSPAVIHLVNLETGRSFHAGERRPDVLQASFHPSDDV